MKYQVLFLVNHGTTDVVLTVETPRSEPHYQIVRHADLLVECDPTENTLALYGDAPYKVHKDRMAFFTPRVPCPEEVILKWLEQGQKTIHGKLFEALNPYRRKA